MFVHKAKNLVCYVLKTLLFLELITLLVEAVTNTVFSLYRFFALKPKFVSMPNWTCFGYLGYNVLG